MDEQRSPEIREVKSNCHYCGYLCGFVATVQDGRLVDLRPDPSRYPYDESIVKACRRWRMNLTEIDSPTRINYPLHRVGERGGGQWERVSWDQALDDIASRMTQLVDAYGPGTVASAIGGPHATYWPLHRFLNMLGSPNNMGIGQICWNPRVWTDILTFGWTIEADINPQTSGAVVLWATNPAVSDNSLFWRVIQQVAQSDVPLVVIDPRNTQTAQAADLHLAPFPATDCTLALGLIRQVIEDDLIDHEFVERWCHGYEGLVQHVRSYTPEFVEKVTGVPAGDVVRAARIIGSSKATAILSGRGIDQVGANTLPTHRAIALLRAITGNVDKPGACVLNVQSDYIPEVDMEMSYPISLEARARQLNAAYSPLQCYDGWDGANALTSQLGRRLPMRYLASATPYLVWNAAITGQPYPVRALIVEACNPLVTYANTHLVHQALQHMELVVVLEYHMTPTAAMADYVLPAAAALERPLFQAQGGVANVAYGGGKAVEPYYERKCDYWVFRELGLRMGQDDCWPQETLEEALDVQLSTTPMDWDTFKDFGLYYGRSVYYKHELVDPQTGQPQGFGTTTGKAELRNEYLLKLGATEYPEPLPLDDEVDIAFGASLGLQVGDGGEVVGAAGSSPILRVTCDDDAVDDGGAGSAPDSGGDPHVLRLMTGARMQPFWASSYLDNPSFRKTHPHPTAGMSTATMQRAGIAPGQWVRVRTSMGSARFLAREEQMVDGVVSVEYGWWFPERDPDEPGLGGIWESNANVLTSGDVQTSEPLIGSWKYNGILCEVQPE